MGKKKNIHQSTSKSNDIKEKKSNESIKNSLIKTYGIIGALILSYFLLTFSVNSIDKKMDKLSGTDMSIKFNRTVDDNLFYLSANDHYIGLSRCTKLPLGRLSIKDYKISSNDNTKLMVYPFNNDNKNTLIISGKNDSYTKVVFTDITDSNGSKVEKEVTIEIPNDEYFFVSANYSTKYENIKIIKADNTVIELK